MARVPIDVETARVQHGAYERTLASLGCRVVEVPAAHDLPDSVFIEDTAIVLDEVAIITRPGAQSRQRETDAVAEALASWRQLRLLSPPALLDGGDVLRLGRVLYVGIGSRTNVAAARQLADSVTPYGYAVRAAEAVGCLHLKSAVTELAPASCC